MNELHELMAFLQMRLSEDGSMQILGGSHDMPDPVPTAKLKQWLQVQPERSFGFSVTCALPGRRMHWLMPTLGNLQEEDVACRMHDDASGHLQSICAVCRS